MKVDFPWLSMDVRLPNPYYRELYDQWELVDEHPTLVLIDHTGTIRYRGQGKGDGSREGDIDYRVAFDLIGTLLAEAPQPTGWHIGNRAIDFTLQQFGTDESVTLSDHFGETILLTFWGTGCIECGDLVPGVYAQLIQETYGGPEKLTVIGVDQYTPLDFLEEYIAQMEIEYPVLLDPTGGVFNRYRIGQDFLFIVIDSEGIIRYRGEELSSDIEKVLDELIVQPSEEE